MAFASTAFGQLSYAPETTPGQTPSSGTGVRLRTTGPTAKAQTQTVKSEEIQPNRMVRGSTLVDLTVDGGFDFEMSKREYDPFLAGVLCGKWAHYGTDGLGDAVEVTTTTNTITASAATSGASDFTTLGTSRWFKLVPPDGASAAVKEYFRTLWLKTHETTAPTDTVITLSDQTPLAGVGVLSNQARFKVSSSVVDNGRERTSFTLEWDQTDIGQFLVYRGMRPNTMSLEFDVGAIVKGSFGFFGQSHDILQSSSMPGHPNLTPSQDGDVMNAVTDMGIVSMGGVNILAGGSSFIRRLSFEVNNNLRGQKALGVFGSVGVGYGEFAVSGSMDCYFEDEKLYRQALQHKEFVDLVFGIADADGSGYLIEMTRVKLKDPGVEFGGKDGDVMVKLPFDAYYDGKVERGIRITRTAS